MKPDFSIENVNCENVLECLFDLSKLDKRVLNILNEGGEYRSKDLAEELEKDQSTVYRSLENLVRCGLVYKEKRTIRKGGYYFLYSSRPIDKIREEAEECLEDWYSKIRSSIEDL
ncbi:MAG: helix-turn-helix domain-containing protein [Candidatus Saliniplasma sp.]